MIKTKGTANAIDKLIGANLSNLDQEISFYEDWGFRVGEYGSIDSNQVIDLVIDEARKVQESKTVVQLLDSGDTADSITTHLKRRIFISYLITLAKNIFFTRDANVKEN